MAVNACTPGHVLIKVFCGHRGFAGLFINDGFKTAVFAGSVNATSNITAKPEYRINLIKNIKARIFNSGEL